MDKASRGPVYYQSRLCKWQRPFYPSCVIWWLSVMTQVTLTAEELQHHSTWQIISVVHMFFILFSLTFIILFLVQKSHHVSHLNIFHPCFRSNYFWFSKQIRSCFWMGSLTLTGKQNASDAGCLQTDTESWKGCLLGGSSMPLSWRVCLRYLMRDQRQDGQGGTRTRQVRIGFSSWKWRW